jgi:hypothetical protein
MAHLDKETAFNSLHEYVFEGLWENHNYPGYERWTGTLLNVKALCILGGLSALLALT